MSIPQTVVNSDPTPGLSGDFCSANPRYSMIAGPGQLVAGAAGVIVGRFAWARNDNGQVSNAHPGVPARLGFVGRNQPALITTWLAQFGNTVQPGLEITLFDAADLWMGPFTSAVTMGFKVFVSYADGTMSAAAAGAAVTGTAITATTNSTTTLSALSGPLLAGQPISGTGIPAGAYVVTGGATGGTAIISAAATASASGVSITPTTALETKWFADSTQLSGENAMTSTRG
jgi:hypothetical protein